MKNSHVLIATGFGLGYFPIAPGTAGAMGGFLMILPILLYCHWGTYFLAFLIPVVFILGVYVSGKLIPFWGKDPPRIVIDEIVGVWIAMVGLPTSYINLISAFVLFRILDIYKPFFIKKTEKLKNGWGIMMDDALAGLYTNLAIQITHVLIFKIF